MFPKGYPPEKVKSIEDIVEKIRQRGDSTPEGEWIRAAGYNELELADQFYLANGITSIQDVTWSNSLSHWEYYQELKRDGRPPPRGSNGR